MADILFNLFHELQLPTSVTEPSIIINAINDHIMKWQARANISRFREEALSHLNLLRELKQIINTNPSIINQHASAYNESEDFKKLEQELRAVGKIFVNNGEISKDDLAKLVRDFKLSESLVLNILNARVKKNKILGIDVGNSFIHVAYVDEHNRPVALPTRDGLMTPSVVAFEDNDGKAIVGKDAQEMLAINASSVFSYFKNEMWDNNLVFAACGQEHSMDEIVYTLISSIYKDVCGFLGEVVKDVVFTCPYAQADSIFKCVGSYLNLNVLSVIEEPVAAAVYYCYGLENPQNIIVYNLGGGYFEISIIRVEKNSIQSGTQNNIQIISVGRMKNFGGKDWDDAIREFVIHEYAEKTGSQCDEIYGDHELMCILGIEAETAKRSLTRRPEAVIRLNEERIHITLDKFEEITKNLLDSTIDRMHSAMTVAKKRGITHFDRILLLGGSSNMLQVKKRINNEFPDIPAICSDPCFAISKGAAIYGNNMTAYKCNIEDTIERFKVDYYLDDLSA